MEMNNEFKINFEKYNRIRHIVDEADKHGDDPLMNLKPGDYEYYENCQAIIAENQMNNRNYIDRYKVACDKTLGGDRDLGDGIEF